MTHGKSEADRVDLATALGELLALARATESEEVASESALGRVTAEPVRARIPSPHYRGSAMDGIAVAAFTTAGASSAAPVLLREVDANTAAPGAGEHVCCVVDTGNPLPDWTDAVVRREATRHSAGGFEISVPVPAGRDVRAIGEDVDAGAPILPRGHRIRPFDIGALLATGNDRVAVRRRPTVAVLATGAEIVEPGTSPRAGQIVEYNSRMLAGFVHEAGGETHYLGRAADDVATIEKTVAAAAASFDLVCVIAGSSQGRKDFTLEALAACGEMKFRGVEMMPGKPTGLAIVGGKPVLAIPGYPVSAVIAYRELVAPFLAAALATAGVAVERVRAWVRRDTPSRLGVEEMLRVCLATDGDTLVVAPLPRGAGSVTTLVGADGILRIPAASEGIARDTEVEVELLRARGEIGRTVVVAGPPHPLFAAFEDECRRAGREMRIAYLRLSALDSTSALVAGEAHCAMFRADEDCGVPDACDLLTQRLPDWRGYSLRDEGDRTTVVAFAPPLSSSPLAYVAGAFRSLAERRGLVVTSIGSGAERS